MFPFESIAMAQGVGATAAANPMIQFVPFILIFVVFYFLIIRPQQKKQKSLQLMLTSLKKGDEIITNGGIYGVIFKIGEDWITLEVADKVRIKVERAQIARLSPDSIDKKSKESASSDGNADTKPNEKE